MKQMKQLFMIGFIAISMIACNDSETSEAENESTNNDLALQKDYTLNTNESVLNWKGSMIGVYSHEGTLSFKDGTLSVKDGKIVKASFVVDMNSMLTTDDDALYVKAPREKLIGHLQAEDFFATETYPESSFTFKSAEGNELTGDLTIKGVTNSEKVKDVKITEENGQLIASGELVFDRQTYNITYKNMMNDMVLSDDIELTFNLIANLK